MLPNRFVFVGALEGNGEPVAYRELLANHAADLDQLGHLAAPLTHASSRP